VQTDLAPLCLSNSCSGAQISEIWNNVYTYRLNTDHSRLPVLQKMRFRGIVNTVPIQYGSIHGPWGALERRVSCELADTRDLQGTTHGCANVVHIVTPPSAKNDTHARERERNTPHLPSG
jgi:hypothetical protein